MHKSCYQVERRPVSETNIADKTDRMPTRVLPMFFELSLMFKRKRTLNARNDRLRMSRGLMLYVKSALDVLFGTG
jgi:hypothetical protein